MDWDWDEFQRQALEGASLGFLRTPPRRLKRVTPQTMPTLRELLAEKMAQQNAASQPRTFQSEFADAASLGFWPRR